MSSKRPWAISVAGAVLVFAAFIVLRPQSAPPQPPSTVASGTGASSEVPSPVPADTVESPPPVEPAAVPLSEPAPSNSAFDPEKIVASFSGRVTDLHGKPIASARVVVVGPRMSSPTNADGYYEISVPAIVAISATARSDGSVETNAPTQYELIAEHDDYSESDRVTVSVDQRSVNFTLRPLGAIEGRVVAARNGQPVTEFRIRPELRHDPEPTTLEADFKRIRDEAGRFRLDRIKAGTATISVGAKGFADTTINIPPVVAGETRERVEVRLEPGAVLRGQVVDQDGHGVRFAQASGGYPRRGDVTDSEGNFELDSLTTGPLELTVKHEKYAPKKVTVVLGNATVNHTRVVLGMGSIIEGEFTRGGRPYRGDVHVDPVPDDPRSPLTPETIAEQDSRRCYGRAGDDGRYKISGVPVGRVRVRGTFQIWDECHCTWSKTIETTVADGETHKVDLDFPMNEAVVSGALYAAPKKPPSGSGSVRVSYADFTPEGPTQIMVNAQTNGGNYGLCLPSGPALLTLVAKSESRAEGTQVINAYVDLKPGDRLRHDFLFYSAATIRVELNGSASSGDPVVVFRGDVDLPDVMTAEFIKSTPMVSERIIDTRHTTRSFGVETGTYTVVALGVEPSGDSVTMTVRASKVVRVEEGQTVDVTLTVNDSAAEPD
jgi:hypothetical protein